MFCPNCAAQNLDGASFCRVCGANISLIPQALSGQLAQAPEPDDSRSRRRRGRKEVEPSLERGIMNVFIGLGFIVAAMAVMSRFPGGIFWGWSFFFPGFSTLGRGIASIVAARRSQSGNSLPAGAPGAYFPNQPNRSAAPALGGTSAARTGELRAPVPSVTEGTTRHLGAEAPTRHLDE
ncbi:MAG TPA: zinc ribbon domain-containing protein [Pyrinomonadaceae bacterium]|jgi:hypothetical protein|nr:zinc ribbon domain-containing protein [Pyrinomonadaceae bacterium]